MKFAFISGIGQVRIGDCAGFYLFQSMASLEMYLRALNVTEVTLAMERSLTLALNPNCTFQ
jgi:hypothetical protein